MAPIPRMLVAVSIRGIRVIRGFAKPAADRIRSATTLRPLRFYSASRCIMLASEGGLGAAEVAMSKTARSHSRLVGTPLPLGEGGRRDSISRVARRRVRQAARPNIVFRLTH